MKEHISYFDADMFAIMQVAKPVSRVRNGITDSLLYGKMLV